MHCLDLSSNFIKKMYFIQISYNTTQTWYAQIQDDSKLLSGFPWPIIFKRYVPRKAHTLKLFSILQYQLYRQ
jgi:hypothetical protein